MDDQDPWHHPADDQPHWHCDDQTYEAVDSDDVTSLQATTCTAIDEFSTVEEQIEQDVVVAFIMTGANMDDEVAAEEASSCVHDELYALYSRARAVLAFLYKSGYTASGPSPSCP